MDPETESEPVSPILGSRIIGGEEGAQAEVTARGNGGLAVTLEKDKKDR